MITKIVIIALAAYCVTADRGPKPKDRDVPVFEPFSVIVNLIRFDISSARYYLIKNDKNYLETFQEGPEAVRDLTERQQPLNAQWMSLIGELEDLIVFMDKRRHFETMKPHEASKMVQDSLDDATYLEHQWKYYEPVMEKLHMAHDDPDKELRAKKYIEGYQILSQCVVRLTYIKAIMDNQHDIVNNTENASHKLGSAITKVTALRDVLWGNRAQNDDAHTRWVSNGKISLRSAVEDMEAFKSSLKSKP